MNKRFIFIIFFIFCFVLKIDESYSTITNKIIAKVDNQIISSYELKNKIMIILFLSKKQLNQNNIDKTKNFALRSLIDNKLKKNEVINNKIKADKNDVKNYLGALSANFNTNIEGFEKLMDQNGIDFDLFLDEIKNEYAWQRLVFRLYKDKIVLNEQEVIDELNTFIANQQDLETFELAEIEIFSGSAEENNKNISEIQNQIIEIGFNDTAVKFSQSSSALNGGNIGWVNSKSLSQNILNTVENLKVGDISAPIFQTNSIIFLKLLNKKKETINNINVEEVKANIINGKRNELLGLFSNNYLSIVKNKAFIKFNE